MRIRLAVPDSADLTAGERKDALDAALESVTRAATPLIKRGKVPFAADAIRAGRVKWQPEPPGDEHFDLPQTVLARGWGDCDDLAPWHAASMRASGRDPGARAVVRPSGPGRWHAIVQRSDGGIEDPSVAAGMHSRGGVNGDEVVGAGASVAPPMCADRRLAVCICVMPSGHAYARVDLPDKSAPWAWSGSATHQDAVRALRRAVRSTRAVAGDGDIEDEDDVRLGVLEDLLSGCPPEMLAEALDHQGVDGEAFVTDGMHSIGFLDFVTKPLSKVMKPFQGIAKKAAPFFAGIPGPFGGVVNAFAQNDPMAAFGAMRAAQGGFGGPGGGMPQDSTPAFMRAREFFAKNPLGPIAQPIAQTVLPTMFPGFGSLFMGLATQGLPQRPMPKIPGMPAGFDPSQLAAMFGGMIPGMPGGGGFPMPGGGGFPMPGGGGFPIPGMPPGVDPSQLAAMFGGMPGAGAPPSARSVPAPMPGGPAYMVMERGVPVQPFPGGPTMMRF